MIRYINVGKKKKMYFQHNIRCFCDFVGIREGYGEFEETIVGGHRFCFFVAIFLFVKSNKWHCIAEKINHIFT